VRRGGRKISCKGWQQEAALRMLMNQFGPGGGEKPQELIVLWRDRAGGAELGMLSRHRAVVARAGWGRKRCWCNPGSRWEFFARTSMRPRVLLCNSNLVGQWDNWDKFNELDRAGLTMYGQMTAGSWIYIGTQGFCRGPTKRLRRRRRSILAASWPASWW